MKYFEDAQSIWKEFVPPSGQSENIQGELLRAVEKLRDESIRNGNGHWDSGFDILLKYLSNKLNDAVIFKPTQLNKINVVLNPLRDFASPCLDDDHYDFLGDCAVEYFRHYGSRTHN